MVEEVSDAVIGVPLHTAARVIGVAEDRLRRWDRSGLVEPDHVAENGRGSLARYSLDHLVQGCVIAQLEDRGIHIRVIRRIVWATKDDEITDPLCQLRWGTEGRHVCVQYPSGEWVDGHAPGQTVMRDVLDLEMIRAEARRKVRERAAEDEGDVERRRGTLHSSEVFAGTRTPVSAVHSYIARDLPDERIMRAFPHLTSEDIATARRLYVAS